MKDNEHMQFNDLGLAKPIMRALKSAGHETPTPIQAAAIPAGLEGRDLIGMAQTGTGKTAAFALPILNRLHETPAAPAPKSCRALVLSPTRELAGQIARSFGTYGKHMRCSVGIAIGGTRIGGQAKRLKSGVDILVATPGRLLDLIRTRALDISSVEVLVLDEADRMLDMGFINDIRQIVALVPADRQTMLFSATMPKEIARLADDLLTEPTKVSVTPPASTAERVEQSVIHLDRSEKPVRLAELLKDEAVERAIIFTRTKHGADRVVRQLAKAGIDAAAIHGNKSQSQREKALKAFRSGRIANLIATDIAARGIDVAGISHVFNYDLPNEPETYVHRIGRTARAGREGIAIALCAPDETAFLRGIEKLIKQTIAVAEGSDPAADQGWQPEIHAAQPAQKPRRRNRHRGGKGKAGDGRPNTNANASAKPNRRRRKPNPHRGKKAAGNGRPRKVAEAV